MNKKNKFSLTIEEMIDDYVKMDEQVLYLLYEDIIEKDSVIVSKGDKADGFCG